MKKTRWIILGVLVFFASLLLGMNRIVRAENGTLINSIDGASIRIKSLNSEQGLMFSAVLDEAVKNNEHGFYLVFGEASISSLITAITEQVNDTISLNDKNVHKVIVPGVKGDNSYSVVLTGIPDIGYFDVITVIPYVNKDGVEEYANPIIRSVAAVALKMANDGADISNIVSADKILNTTRKRVIRRDNGDIEIKDSIYETNPKTLKKEFIKDWNKLFNAQYTDFDNLDFYDAAKVPLVDDEQTTNKDLSATNLYQFFNNYEQKWSWLLDYMISQCEIMLVSNQARAIKGNGTYNNNLLFNGVHLSLSIVNFFNQKYLAEYPGIDFTQLERYDEVKNYNMSIYIDLTNGNLYKVGHRLNLHNNVEKEGYTFEYYQRGENRLYDGDTYTIGEAERLVANYKAIDYAVKFYDGDNELVEYRTTYNVETGLALPNYGKENYLFFGWYTDPDFSGAPLEEINIGQTGNLNLYAYLEKELIEEVYNITYHLNGGQLPTGDIPTTFTIESGNIILPIPTKLGSIFKGWYTDPNFNGTAVTQINSGTVNDKVYYAKWELEGPTDADKALDAKNALEITYASGDSATSVTQNVTLPTTGMHSAVITWATSNSGAITTAGAVTRSTASDVTVTLTATIKVNLEQETKTFTLLVKKIDAATEYTITYHLNGGAWPTSGGTGGYTNRDVMITDFLTEFHGYLTGKGVITMSASDFMHGAGKTSGFDGSYNNHMADLRAINDKTINPEGGFVNQAQYNKWVPLIDLMDEFVGKVNPEQAGEFWSSNWTANLRMKPFVMKTPIGQVQAGDEIYTRIPTALQSGGGGTPITPPSKYTPADNDITLPVPVKDGDPFIGWYDNANLYGTAITKIVKGSSGNKVFYARYNSSTVVAPPLSDSEKLTEAKAALNVGYASGDSASSVTKNVTLPSTGLHSVTVTWATSDATTITTGGVVTRKESGNITVTLTATLKIGSLTETKQFTLTVKKLEPEPTTYTIEYVLNGGGFAGYTNKTQMADAFMADLYAFVGPTESLAAFKHGAGKTSGYKGLWFTNEDYKAKVYAANVKSGNNNYFLSHSTYGPKWKPLADFMVNFVKVGNPDQSFWASPYTGCIRLQQYLGGVKPGGAWTDEDMAAMPSGLSATAPYEYNPNSLPITLPTATRSGYTFEGWYTNADFSGGKVTQITAGSTGNKKYYAKWSQPIYTITLNLNGGNAIGKFTKSQLAEAFLNDLYSFIRPTESLTVFKHGAGKTSGYKGLWFTNEDYRAKVYAANVKSGNNEYFLSHAIYGPKWKPLADFMVNFVKKGNPDQNFWASPYTGCIRLQQYLGGVKPSSAWTNADMNATPNPITPKNYVGGSQAIILPPATRTGHSFKGWYTASSGGTKVTQIAANATGNKTYYAQWTALPTETLGDKILAFARTKVGGPYVWGGNGPVGYDCSGLTKAAYASVGITIPRVAKDQAYGCRRIYNKADLKPGDLVFWNSPATHVAIWVGNNRIVHAANSSVGIVEGPIYGSPYFGTYWW